MGKIVSIENSTGTLSNGLTISVAAAGANGKIVAVTGADGFIGSHIVNILLGKGYVVRGTVQDLDEAKVGFLRVLHNAAENLSLFKGELLDQGCFDDVFQGCDCVFHLASPTLKEQREMKSPEDEMIDQAVGGTLNVLQSCKKAGVKTVVITSTMFATIPKRNRPKIINESHWADHGVQKNNSFHYSASKTLAERAAVEFVAKLPTETAFRLVRICPTLTVGPMLQPTVNSSMERFAAICSGAHHKRTPNSSISLIDVRDTAAHHVAAYEKGLEGRFFSTLEAWPWSLFYQALKFYRPQMKSPEPLPVETNLLPIFEYSKTRMDAFGIKERSMMKVLGDAVKECEQKQLLNSGLGSFQNASFCPFLYVAGYYDLGSGNGTFLMVDVQCTFEPDQTTPVYQVQVSYVIGSQTKPTVIPVQEGLLTAGCGKGVFKFVLYPFDLEFQMSFAQDQRIRGTVFGTINGTSITGYCYMTYIPYTVYAGTYITEDGSDTVTLALSEGNNSITFSDGSKADTFTYYPIIRKFSIMDGAVIKNLYMNFIVETGQNVLKITFVQYNRENPESDSSVTDFFKNTKRTSVPLCPFPAFGYRTLTGTKSTLRITKGDGQSRLVLIKDHAVIFDTTEYVYNNVQQVVLYNQFKLNFCYLVREGVTCNVSKTDTHEELMVLYAYPEGKISFK